MSKITPLMTSLHEGHKAEERLKCIDNMLFKKCDDTKDTILQAFWWYRKYTKAELEKLGKIEQIMNATEYIENGITYSYCYNQERKVKEIKEVLESEEILGEV